MNTTLIGDQFETKSLEIIKRVIEEEQLGHLGKHLRIYTKKEKGYYSATRQKDIYFDLTIEVWPPGASRYVLIYIIECKNYNKRVPVDDTEEFCYKIQQVSGVNVKGIFISNAPLQQSAFNVADSVGMMVIQGESSDNYKLILHKTDKRLNQERIPFIHTTKDEGLFDDGITLVERLIDKKITKIFEENTNISRVSYNIDKLSKSDIENYSKIELDKINPRILSSFYQLSIEAFTKFLQEKEQIFIIENEESLLGWCDIKNRTIGVNRAIKNTS
ncbi:hypothetical protein [Catalinimonas niigatensis]|uniref:hypothetical protein n=1 Tax=Catalinimonas niigatensis TaxID=1397264 RepID=UPI00266585A1|nr:hypothetical protein [Catalinimonas niigatensis]WPP48570.1 hypothetical protein PZB72_18020 [Catalinimonas niigatensis]